MREKIYSNKAENESSGEESSIRGLINKKREENLKVLSDVSQIVMNVYSGNDLGSIESLEGIVSNLKSSVISVFAGKREIEKPDKFKRYSHEEKPVLESYVQYVDLRCMEMSHEEIVNEMAPRTKKQFGAYLGVFNRHHKKFVE